MAAFPGEPTRRLTIQTKLSGLILALVAAIVVPFSLVRSARPARVQEAQLESKARLYGTLAADRLGAALDPGGDRRAVGPLFQLLAADPDVQAVGLYSGDGNLVAARGALEAGVAPTAAVREPSFARRGAVARALYPVVSAAGPRGTLVLDLSAAAIDRQRTAALHTALLMGGIALALGLLAAWLIGRSFARRVRAVSEQAAAVAAGDLSRRPLQDQSSDEIGQMARAFKRMVDRLRTLITQIKESAKKEAERLELVVTERTHELNQRNAEMRLVLDNVEQGFVVVDRAGWLCQMSSRVVESWLGPPTPRIPFADWLFRSDPNQLAMFNLAWDALTKDELPRDLLLDQLPRRVELDGRTLEVAYKPIKGVPNKRGTIEEVTSRPGGEPRIGRVLVVITDVTSQLARVRAEQAQRELASVMARYSRDRNATLTFLDEARATCARVAEGGLAGDELLRALHTLKGNAGLMGLTSLSTVCHDLESILVDEGKLSDVDGVRLGLAWAETEQRVGFLLAARDKLEIAETDFAAVVRAAERGAPRAELLRLLEACRSESVAKRLQYFADQARRIAESLGKLPLDVRIDAGALTLPRGALAEFWTAFVHVVRNAVDHGLEDAATRQAAGKPEIRSLTLRARVEADHFVVEIEDDGRGIDWETIFTRAQAAGLPTATREDLVRTLCAGGISTRTEVSELSGRGVGMKAVREACAATSGTLQIQSEPGRGALMRFRWAAKGLGLQEGDAAAPVKMSAPHFRATPSP